MDQAMAIRLWNSIQDDAVLVAFGVGEIDDDATVAKSLLSLDAETVQKKKLADASTALRKWADALDGGCVDNALGSDSIKRALEQEPKVYGPVLNRPPNSYIPRHVLDVNGEEGE